MSGEERRLAVVKYGLGDMEFHRSVLLPCSARDAARKVAESAVPAVRASGRLRLAGRRVPERSRLREGVCYDLELEEGS